MTYILTQFQFFASMFFVVVLVLVPMIVDSNGDYNYGCNGTPKESGIYMMLMTMNIYTHVDDDDNGDDVPIVYGHTDQSRMIKLQNLSHSFSGYLLDLLPFTTPAKGMSNLTWRVCYISFISI